MTVAMIKIQTFAKEFICTTNKYKRRTMKFYKWCKVTDTVDFTNNILILPALTIGNVGQLCVDLLVQNIQGLTKVGYLYSDYVLPLVGNDPYHTNPPEQGAITTSLEVFQKKDANVTVVQQRAPVIKRHSLDFAKELVEWIKQSKFKEVLFLSSTEASRRIDAQLEGTQLRYHSVNNANQRVKELSIKQLEAESIPLAFKKGSVNAGIAQECESNGINLTTLILFCNEGNNIPESMFMAQCVNEVLQFKESVDKWRLPASWAHIESGTNVDDTIF